MSVRTRYFTAIKKIKQNERVVDCIDPWPGSASELWTSHSMISGSGTDGWLADWLVPCFDDGWMVVSRDGVDGERERDREGVRAIKTTATSFHYYLLCRRRTSSFLIIVINFLYNIKYQELLSEFSLAEVKSRMGFKDLFRLMSLLWLQFIENYLITAGMKKVLEPIAGQAGQGLSGWWRHFNLAPKQY